MIVSDCTVLRESVWLADLEAITDPHVRSDGALAGKVDTARMFVQGIAHLVSLEPRPDVVLMTGDLVDEGSESEYRVLRDILTPLDIPLYMIPGNHDDRDALRTVFSDLTYLFEGGPFINYLVEDFPLRLVALDSVVPGRGSGSLCEARLAWLDARLAEDTSRPTVIIMHHPPFETGIGHMDAVSLGNKEALAEVVARYSNVERILWRTCTPPDLRPLRRHHSIHGPKQRPPNPIGPAPRRALGFRHGTTRLHDPYVD